MVSNAAMAPMAKRAHVDSMSDFVTGRGGAPAQALQVGLVLHRTVAVHGVARPSYCAGPDSSEFVLAVDVNAPCPQTASCVHDALARMVRPDVKTVSYG
jgi:hypothetical protein